MMTFNAVISKIVAKSVDNVETIQKRTLTDIGSFNHANSFRGEQILFTILKGLGFLGKIYGSVYLEKKNASKFRK